MLLPLRPLPIHLFLPLLVITSMPVAVAQKAVDRNSLVIQGPELEVCEVTMRYYKARQLAKAMTTMVALMGGEIEEPLEPGFDGIEVFVRSASSPLDVSLRTGQKIVQQEQLKEPGAVQLRGGKVGRAPFQPQDIKLSESETKLVGSLIAAFVEPTTTKSLVSNALTAAVDYPCLDVFVRELPKLIGQVEAGQSATDGWMGWQDESDNRVLGGVVRGQSGRCGLKLTLSDGMISNVQLNCPLLPDNHLSEPLETAPYQALAEQITRNLFDGNAQQAHQLYSSIFQQQVTVEQLQQLSQNLHSRYGKKIVDLQPKQTELMAYNFNQRVALLNVDSVLQLDSGAKCISRVVFSIPSSRVQVGRGHLGAVNIFQTFNSAHPQFAQKTQTILQQIVEGMQASQLVDSYPDSLQAVARKAEVQELLDRLASQMPDTPPEVDFERWTAQDFGGAVQASGPVRFGSSDYFVELHFLGEDRLIGLSIYGPATAQSTLGLFDFDSALGEVAKEFWTKLLKEDAQGAHAMLDAEFQTQFPLTELKKQLESPDRKQSPLKQIVVEHVRLNDQASSPRPLMVNVYLMAELNNREKLPLNCQLAWPTTPGSGDAQKIFDFSNDFITDFPVSSIALTETKDEGAMAALRAFQSFDQDQLLSLIQPERRKAVDRTALEAYLAQLKQLSGGLKTPDELSRSVEYQSGLQSYRCNAIFPSESNQRFPMELWFSGGYLDRFTISHPQMSQFTSLLKDTSNIEKMIRKFVSSWFAGGTDNSKYLLPLIASEAMQNTLAAYRDEFNQECGKLKDIRIQKTESDQAGNRLDYEVTLQGGDGQKTVKLQIEVGAFGGLVSGLIF
jgi:hypothetical protein